MKIFIFVGQFGNEIGCKLISSMGFKDRGPTDYFTIMVDTESKVIRRNKKVSSKFQGSYLEMDARGRGSNWAMGYHLNKETKHNESILERVIKLVQRKLEHCSGFSGGLCLGLV